MITSKTVNFPKRPYDINDPNTFITTIFGSAQSGRSGDVTVIGSGNLTFDRTMILSTTQGIESAGNISITSSDSITFKNNSQITAQTSSTGQAGNIDLKAGTSILFNAGTGLFANTTLGSTGSGGNIAIASQSLTLQDGAAIAVDSLGSGIGGSINIFSDYLSLLSGSITASTANTNGGNINLNIPSILLMRYASDISATASSRGRSSGNGGNIDINAGFIVALKGENSNISANAFTGNGGNININTNGIYGLEFRSQLTDFSDITASSQFGLQGNVLVTTIGIDPSHGLTALPVNLVDPSKQINQSCALGGNLSNRQNRFTIAGRGGLPKSPSDELASTQPLVELTELVPSSTNQISAIEQKQEFMKEVPQHIVEANAIVKDNYGKIRLINSSQPLSPAIPQVACTQ